MIVNGNYVDPDEYTEKLMNSPWYREQQQQGINFLRNTPVSILAGTAKIIGDVPQLIAPNNAFSKNWNDGVDYIRDSLQSQDLLDERKGAEELLLSKYKGEVTKDFLKEVVQKFPNAAVQYGMEYVTPVGGFVKGATKTGLSLSKVPANELAGFGRYLLGKAGLAADIGGTMGDILEAKENYLKSDYNLEGYRNRLWNGKTGFNKGTPSQIFNQYLQDTRKAQQQYDRDSNTSAPEYLFRHPDEITMDLNERDKHTSRRYKQGMGIAELRYQQQMADWDNGYARSIPEGKEYDMMPITRKDKTSAYDQMSRRDTKLKHYRGLPTHNGKPSDYRIK